MWSAVFSAEPVSVASRISLPAPLRAVLLGALDVRDRRHHSATSMAETLRVAMRQVAAKLRDAARVADTVCRIGGEEFLVICRQADNDAAQQCGERLRRAIARDPIAVGDAAQTITISVGVATTLEGGVRDAQSLLECADRALYAAKREGRDRVAIAA